MAFPITERVTSLDNLPEGSENLHSVVRGRNDFDVPTPPAVDSDGFAVQEKLFKLARHDVHADIWPSGYFEAVGIDPAPPKMFEQFGVVESDPTAAATLVDHKMDAPLDLHGVFSSHFKGIEIQPNQKDRSPQSFGVDFLGWREFDAYVLNKIYEALVEAFQVKYHFVVARPEHYFACGDLVCEYNCPWHPSYVAGHGAIAGATVQAWADRTNISPEQLAEATHAGQQYADYRLFAGVHWPMDNEWGFKLGRLKTAA